MDWLQPNWLQLIYQYTIGGIYFVLTTWLCFRPGASSLKTPSDRRALVYLLIGFVGYLAAHTVWILLAE